MILSLIQPTTGSVELLGYQLEKEREKALAKVAGIVEGPTFTWTSPLTGHGNCWIVNARENSPREKILTRWRWWGSKKGRATV